jgi:hypothetical protein
MSRNQNISKSASTTTHKRPLSIARLTETIENSPDHILFFSLITNWVIEIDFDKTG